MFVLVRWREVLTMEYFIGEYLKYSHLSQSFPARPAGGLRTLFGSRSGSSSVLTRMLSRNQRGNTEQGGHEPNKRCMTTTIFISLNSDLSSIIKAVTSNHQSSLSICPGHFKESSDCHLAVKSMWEARLPVGQGKKAKTCRTYK